MARSILGLLDGNKNNLKHGLSHTRIYQIWAGMWKRCTRPKTINFDAYGGRGITVCEEWRTFEGFYNDMKNGYQDDLTLDRIDTNGNYEPSNCRWITIKDQQRNKRSVRLVTYKGETKCLSEWAECLGMKRHLIKDRLNNNWPLEKVFNPAPTPRTAWKRNMKSYV